MCDVGVRINAHVDAALEAAHRPKPPRDYLGGSRIGEPCARRLAYEVTLTPVEGMGFGGRTAAHLRCRPPARGPDHRWLQAAGFDLRTRGTGRPAVRLQRAGGRIRGHIDGVIVGGPEVGISWPALFEHKALNQSSWTDQAWAQAVKPIYFAQCQLYMAYMHELEVALLTAMNKNTQELYHEVVRSIRRGAGALRQGGRHPARG